MVETRLEVVPCTVCEGDQFSVICSAHEVEVHQEYLRRFHLRRLRPNTPRTALVDRADFTQDYPTDIMRCCQCGLLFRNPRPTPEAVQRMYSQDEYGRERLELMYESQVELYRPKARMLARRIPPNPRALEVGSFVGGFLAAGRERGWEMLGVDPGEEVTDFCRERGLWVFQGTLEDAPVEEGSLDAVAIWNTFDQLPDPLPTLNAASRMLRRGGALALRIPNGECFRWGAHWIHRLREKRWGSRPLLSSLLAFMAWNNLLAFPYLHGYSVCTLDRLLAPYGLARDAVHTDTLTRLADDQNRWWSVWEERGVKWVSRWAARIEALSPRSPYTLSPWLDVYYVKG